MLFEFQVLTNQIKEHTMSDKTFNRLLAAILAAGIISTVLLTGYTIYKHTNCSIITYISNESRGA